MASSLLAQFILELVFARNRRVGFRPVNGGLLFDAAVRFRVCSPGGCPVLLCLLLDGPSGKLFGLALGLVCSFLATDAFPF